MSKGYWCTRSIGAYATGMSLYKFDRYSPSLLKRGKNEHCKEFFIPEEQCTDQFKKNNIPVQQQLNDDVLEQLVANVSFTDDTVDDDSLSKQLKQARLQKIKTDTKLINQKLDQRKKLLFAQWSERFFQQFSNHFGRLRNIVVELHLNEEQTNKFKQTLQVCLANLQLSLDQIWNEFTNQEKEDGQS